MGKSIASRALLCASVVAAATADSSVRVSYVRTKEVAESGPRATNGLDEVRSANGDVIEAREDRGTSALLASSLLGVSDSVATSGSGSWRAYRAETPLSSVAVGFTGQVLGVARSTSLPYAFDARTGKWGAFKGGAAETKLRQAVVSCDSTLYATDATGKLLKKKAGSTEGEWAAIGTESHTFVAVGKDDDIWSIDAAGNAHYYIKAKESFYPAHYKLKSVAVGCNGEVWGVATDGKLVERVDGTFKPRADGVGAVQVRHGVYVLDAENSGTLWRYRTKPSDSDESPRKYWLSLGDASFAQFAVGPDETLWAVDDAGVPHKHSGANMEANLNEAEKAELQLKQGGVWEVLEGSEGMGEVATGQAGEVYGVTPEGAVAKYDPAVKGKWETIPAPKVVRIGTGCDGVSLWGVTADGFTHRYRGNGHWIRYTEKLSDVNVGESEDYVYGLKVGSHELVRYDRSSRRWKIESNREGKPVQMQSVSAGCDRSVWGVDMDGRLAAMSHEHAPGLWRVLGEGARGVAVGRNVYVLDERNFLFQYRVPAPGQKEGKQNWKFLHKQLKVVDTNPAGDIVGIDLEGRAVRFRPMKYPSNSSWKPMTELAPVSQLAVGSRDEIFALDHYGVVLRYTSNRRWTPMKGIYLEQISCGCDGVAWGVRRAGKVYRMPELEVGWELVDSDRDDIARVAVGNAKHVWGLDKGGHPFRFDARSSTWKKFDLPETGETLVDLSVTCRGVVWAAGESGVVYKLAAAGRPRRWIKYGLNAVEVHAGFRTLIVDKAHMLWKYEDERAATQPWKKWVKLGSGMVTVSTAWDGTTWGLTSTGAVWQLRAGTPPQRPTATLGIPTPTPTPIVALDPQPDDQALSPFIAGTRERADTRGSTTDPDDVTSMIDNHEADLKFQRIAGAKSPYSPYEFEEDVVGNSVFRGIDPEVSKRTRENYPRSADDVFTYDNPPF